MIRLLAQAECDRCPAVGDATVKLDRKTININGKDVPVIDDAQLPDGWDYFRYRYNQNDELLCPECLVKAKEDRWP